MKHAMQKPMFAGLPKNTSIAAMTPMTAPPATIATFSFFRSIVIPFFPDPLGAKRKPNRLFRCRKYYKPL